LVDPLHLFRDAERERIRAAIEGAKRGTSAKFAFVAMPASDHYAWFPVVWGAVVALALTGGLALWMPYLSIGAGFVVDAGLFIFLSLLFDWWPLRVRLVPPRFKRLALHQAAQRAYHSHLISRDDAHNGVLLFVSLAEHHLEIVAEREAHEAVPAGTWNRIVTDATAAMAAHGTAEGLVQAISACGAALAQAFPRRP
jgi:putative membrane protein